MHYVAGLIAVLLLLTGTAIAENAPPNCYPKSTCKADCDKTKKKMRKIQSKMRQGYSAAQGAKLEAELRDLRKLRSKLCP